MNVKHAYEQRNKAVWRWSYNKLDPNLIAEVRRTDEALVEAVYSNTDTNEPPPTSDLVYEGRPYSLQRYERGVEYFVPAEHWSIDAFKSDWPNPLDKVRKRISCIAAIEESIADIQEAIKEATGEYVEIEVD